MGLVRGRHAGGSRKLSLEKAKWTVLQDCVYCIINMEFNISQESQFSYLGPEIDTVTSECFNTGCIGTQFFLLRLVSGFGVPLF